MISEITCVDCRESKPTNNNPRPDSRVPICMDCMYDRIKLHAGLEGVPFPEMNKRLMGSGAYRVFRLPNPS